MYATLSRILKKFFKESTIFKYGFNVSPMYRRSTGKICAVSEDLLRARVKIPISYKNRNYVGSIFGGSLFSATDPVFMIQLMNVLGNDYVVWDKEATIKFKRPATQDAYVDFIFTEEEIQEIKERVVTEKEINLNKEIKITNKDESTVFAEVSKVIYIADKVYYKNKRKKK
ncbi:Acyl-coenzyme A thioesterase PaaI-like protein [Tenacibaculum sp. 190130A14a]|uniref:Acyl-coenzyme A thioesterase PaaI-like protein n=1 Tax=Tenacibaculum polynesiense TaxID=3137857 RepID=A0ABP1ETA0_9FLAO